jgi:hypothetical protein
MALLAVTAACGATQAPVPQNTASAFGFVYRLPEDWKIIAPKEPAPALQQNPDQKNPFVAEKKGTECMEVPITARHGDPPTTIVVDALPFACYGQRIMPDELPAFGAGAAEGLKQAFDITMPVEATYRLAGHRMWIQRARAIAKGKTGPTYTLETVCTLLERAAVCWVTRAADEVGLHTFELVPVRLDGAAAGPLVPPNTFVTNP